MTTAHRPTFHAAIGGAEQGGGRYIAGVSRTHVHDLPGQLKLKTRVPGQGTAAEIRARDLRAELEEREEKHFKAIGKPSFSSARALPPPPPADDDDDDDQALIMDPEDADDKPNTRHAAAPPEDSDDDDDDDETEELMRELERIKKERAQEAARKEREEAEMAAKEKDSAILQGNPLLDPTRTGANASGNFQVKRRWDDDVVFKNQSREPKKEARRFINDTVRNDFHRKFLSRYIK
mmetsp:Transcript_24779/g.54106  ORF Transcript_24779/g.54106 Transcript_24779/m.54106 type:complete len:236 (+) Transcript_24779:155-862(+)